MRAKHVVWPSIVVVLLGVSGRLSGTTIPRSAERSTSGSAHVSSDHLKAGVLGKIVAEPTVRQQHIAQLPLLVDGDKNPEQIPDDLAYRHFISVTAARGNASAKDLDRRDAFLARVGLSATDRTAYLKAVNGVSDELANIDLQRRSAATDGALSRLPELKQREVRLLDTAAGRIRGTLSRDGVERVRTHISAHVKKHIKIYGQ